MKKSRSTDCSARTAETHLDKKNQKIDAVKRTARLLYLSKVPSAPASHLQASLRVSSGQKIQVAKPATRRSASSPFWENPRIPKSHDIALLRPSSLTRGMRFETESDVNRYSESLTTTLRRVTNGDAYAEILDDCRQGYYTCGKPFCPLCSRRYRRWLFSETLPIFAHQNVPAHIVTLFFESRALGDLSAADPGRFKDTLRQQMNRVGLDKAVAVGGIEAGLKRDQWILHAHIAMTGAAPIELKRLRRLYSPKETKRSMLVQELKDVNEQLSYIQKFHTYHRPSGSKWAVPMKPPAAVEMVRWLSRYRFEDLLFLKGVRRQGVRLRPRLS
jgi:hypothetical protein